MNFPDELDTAVGALFYNALLAHSQTFIRNSNDTG